MNDILGTRIDSVGIVMKNLYAGNPPTRVKFRFRKNWLATEHAIENPKFNRIVFPIRMCLLQSGDFVVAVDEYRRSDCNIEDVFLLCV